MTLVFVKGCTYMSRKKLSAAQIAQGYPFTEEQRKDVERLLRYIEREQLIALMNDTKWREVIAALGHILNFPIRFRVQCLRSDASPTWDSSFPWHVPQPYNVIEWLDIDPIAHYHRGQLIPDATIDFTEQVVQALQSVSVPFSYEGPFIRVWGYARPNTAPP
jgi:hypothetical protein